MLLIRFKQIVNKIINEMNHPKRKLALLNDKINDVILFSYL